MYGRKAVSLGFSLVVPFLAIRVVTGLQGPSRVEQAELRLMVARLLPAYVRVCDVLQVTLGPTTPPTIVASLDANGRNFCNRVILVQRDPTRIVQSIDSWLLDDVSSVVRDVDRDGRLELVIPRAFSTPEGAGCVAQTPLVFTCGNPRCVESSRQFPAFYSEELDRVERAIAEVAPDKAEEGMPCLIMNRDKVLRLLGVTAAGFEEADAWQRSADPSLRRKAVRVFADIDDVRSKQRLAVLSNDPDPRVASLARLYAVR